MPTLLSTSLPLLLACSAPSGPGPAPAVADSGAQVVDSGASDRPPSFLVVLTDDVRHDMLDPLPQTVSRVFDQGLVFTNAVVNTPLCCPARASIVSGGFLAHQTGVLKNEGHQGGMESFDDSGAIGLSFQAAGYRTAHIGKYLNLYPDDSVYIPPGWDRFVFPMVVDDWTDFPVVIGSSRETATDGKRVQVQQYNTDYLHDQALAFLDGTGDEPFLLVLAELAAHDLAQPAAEDDGAYAGVTWRGGAYNEADVSDKPSFIANLPLIDAKTEAARDLLYQDALESLLAVDRSVAGLLDALESRGRLDDTVVIFTSDNGHLFGEHRLWSKGLPYLESIRVPLAVRMPGGVAGVRDDRLVSASTDVMATLFDLAGIDAPTGGQSFAPLLRGEAQAPQQALLLEGYATGWSPDYHGLVTPSHRYAAYVNGEVELYDIVADPLELLNIAADPDQAENLAAIEAEVDALRGLVLLPTGIQLQVDEPAEVQLRHWGGQGTVRYSADGALPAGLALTQDGLLHGTPTQPGTSTVDVTVTDQSQSPYHGGPEVFTRTLWVTIGAPLPPLGAAPQVRRQGDRAVVRLPLDRTPALRALPLRAWLGFDPALDLNPREVAVHDGVIVVEGLGRRPAWLRVDGLPEPLRIALPAPGPPAAASSPSP